MSIKDLIFNDNWSLNRKKINNPAEEEPEISSGLYSDMLGLNRDFSFILLKSTVIDEHDFANVSKAAKDILEQDLKRLGETFYEIDSALRNKLMGTIGSMTVIADDSGNVTAKFHRRDENGYWDGISKKFPEKTTKGKFKYEIFFTLEDDYNEEED